MGLTAYNIFVVAIVILNLKIKLIKVERSFNRIGCEQMAKTGIPGVIVAHNDGVTWASARKKARGYYFRKYHYPGSIAQKKQQLKLARAATAQFGRVQGPAAVAYAIRDQLRGSVGGRSPEAYRQYKHQKAAATIARLEREVGAAPAPVLPGAP